MGYARTPSNLAQMLKNFSRHLNPGGIVILESWASPNGFRSGIIHLDSVETHAVRISRMGVTKKHGNMSIVTLHHLIGENGKVRYAVDRHELGLFAPKTVYDLMVKAGFKTYIDRRSWFSTTFKRPTYVGVKR